MRRLHVALALVASGALAATGCQTAPEHPMGGVAALSGADGAAPADLPSDPGFLDGSTLPSSSSGAPLDSGQEQRRVIPVPLTPAAYRPRSEPPERLIIPSIGLEAKVIPIGVKLGSQGPEWETAPFSVGGTANPGETSNVVLSGHISSHHEGAIFRRLPEVKEGEGIIIATQQQYFLYRITGVRVTTPATVEILEPTPRAVATLITCFPDGVYSHRLIVQAERL